MSLIAVQGGATGTGTVTLLAPVTNTNRTLTLPDATDTVAGIAATQTLTNKTLTSPTLTTPNINSAQVDTVSGTAPLYFARAWVNFNGTGTVAIRASGNVSSITDSTTGQYIVNFTTSFADSSYSAIATCKGLAATVAGLAAENHDASRTASAYPVATYRRDNGGTFDSEQVNVSVFR